MRAALLAAMLVAGMGPATAQIAQPGSSSNPFVGYLLVHFIGQTLPSDEQTYMAISTDGQNWSDLNDSQPILTSTVGTKGVRDHSIVRSPDGSKYWILATDLHVASSGWSTSLSGGSTSLVIWESNDLVHWLPPRLVDVASGIPGAGCVWAPEAILDPESNAYVVYWTTSAPLNGETKTRVYYAKTTDFITFTAPQLYIDRPPGQHVLDTQIIEIPSSYGGYKYVRASAGDEIWLEGSQSVLGTWTPIGVLSHSPAGAVQVVGRNVSAMSGKIVEGPILFKYNDANKWGLLVDSYGTGGGYVPLWSSNPAVDNWQSLPSGSYNLGRDLKRHGGILNLTASELARVTAQWGGTSPVRRLQSVNYPDRYVRHASFRGRIDSSVSPVDDANFRVVKGLAANGPGYVSFASVNYPGYYLRQRETAIVLEPYDGSPQFTMDATFRQVPGLADGSASSFQSFYDPSMYIRHYAFELWVHPILSALDRSDATFRFTN